MKPNHNQLVSDIKSLIEKLNSNIGNPQSEWANIQPKLFSMIQKDPSLANNSEIICSLVIFASTMTDSDALQFLTNCNGIGNSHSLWFSSIALEYEKQSEYILAFDVFERATKIHAKPFPFLDLKYSEFKKRMTDRLQLAMNQRDFNDNFSLELGTLYDIKYTFINGRVITKINGKEAGQPPQIDILQIIGYDPTTVPSTPMNLTAHNSYASINTSNNTAKKQENYVCGFDDYLLTGPDGREFSFEEQRLLSFGIDFIRRRNLNSMQSDNRYLSQENVQDSPKDQPVLPKKQPRFRKPLQPLEPQKSIDPPESSNPAFSFNENENPRSILKKQPNPSNNNNSVSIIKSGNAKDNSVSLFSPAPRSNTSVTFDNSIPQTGFNDKRRSPTPISRPSTMVPNERINSGSDEIGILAVVKRIGERSYLSINDNKDEFVIKPLTYSDAQNYALSFVLHAQHKELFALQADENNQSPDFFITHYYHNNNLECIINNIRSGAVKIQECISLFFLLQMVLMIQQLEINGFVHGEINPLNLFLRPFPEQKPKKPFGLNEPGWKDTGLVLVRCDQIQKTSSPSLLKKIDREAVYNVFIDLSIKENHPNGFVQHEAPRNWNGAIWKMAFSILSSGDELDPLIAIIIEELDKNPLFLISMFSRIYNTIAVDDGDDDEE